MQLCCCYTAVLMCLCRAVNINHFLPVLYAKTGFNRRRLDHIGEGAAGSPLRSHLHRYWKLKCPQKVARTRCTQGIRSLMPQLRVQKCPLFGYPSRSQLRPMQLFRRPAGYASKRRLASSTHCLHLAYLPIRFNPASS
ncbi:hypothetical protein BDV96DRAFT_221094 [Lophiotrema nucula]|uniref:Secreted protein n=1 Tax=Lophiotrema nucula TaxID=690887 RepID=A0A6A5YTN7_9PLEO|nr:hypothetical protein BDV96DRAFT_221094 [Lophiotrema nucula]